MTLHKAYLGKEHVRRYDDRHFGGKVGQAIFQMECETLDALMPPPPALLLDVPCGTGIYSARFKRHGYKVMAVDASLPMLHMTGQRDSDIDKIRSDIFHLPFPDNTFDVVMTIRLFQHFPKQAVAGILLDLRRVVKPGGRVIFDTFRWTPKQMPCIWRLFKGEMHVLSHREVEEIIDAAGLSKINQRSLHLFSPIRQRKLPYRIFLGLRTIEQIVPQGWLLRTFWACTKDRTNLTHPDLHKTG